MKRTILSSIFILAVIVAFARTPAVRAEDNMLPNSSAPPAEYEREVAHWSQQQQQQQQQQDDFLRQQRAQQDQAQQMADQQAAQQAAQQQAQQQAAAVQQAAAPPAPAPVPAVGPKIIMQANVGGRLVPIYAPVPMAAYRPVPTNAFVTPALPPVQQWQAQQLAMHQADYQHIWI
jgi:multidrug efflux pump subunit AcrA (membrane-fusion protein)